MKVRARNLTLLGLSALAVRLPLLLLSTGAPFDMESYARAAACPGPGLYASPILAGRYPYLPLWWLVLKVLAFAHGLFGGRPDLWFRLPGVIGDVAICWLAYLLALGRNGETGYYGFQRQEEAATVAGLAWALNPLAVLVSAGHGQFDSVALALLLGTVWLLEYSRHPRCESRAALCLGAAVALKTWPLAFLPCCLGVFPSRSGRLRFTGKVLLLPALLPVAWLIVDGPMAIAQHLCYSGANALGLSGALKACFFASTVPPGLWRATDLGFRCVTLVLLASAAAWGLMRAGRLRFLDSLPWAALTLVLLAPGLSPQYLVWAPAVALAVSPRLAWRLSLTALPLVLGFYVLFMPAALVGPLAWAPPAQGRTLIFAWAAANLVWWSWTALEWLRLRERTLRSRRPGYSF